MSSNTAWDDPSILVLIAVAVANLLVASAHFWPEAEPGASPLTDTAGESGAVVATPARPLPLDPVVAPDVAKRVTLRRPAPACLAWGPFSALDEAERLAADLALPPEDFEVFHAEQEAAPDYLVTLRAPGTRASVARVVESLGERGIDSYVLERGPLDNVLAAGVFSARERAEAQARRLRTLGFEPAVEVLARSRDVYHLLARIPPESTPEIAPSAACSEIAPLEQFL